MTKALPGAAGDLAEQHPDIWSVYSTLGNATADSGPLSDREGKDALDAAEARSYLGIRY